MAKKGIMVKKVKKIKKEKKQVKELTRLGKALRIAGGMGGAMAGNLIGYGAEGKHYGTSLGAMISKWLGSGAYKVSQNSLVTSEDIPMMHKSGQSIIVRHREYVCDVIGGSGTPTTFNIGNTLYLNPGQQATFPWLSTVAKQFQEYSFRGVVFHYVSTSGEYSAAGTSLGTVMMHTDYRVTATAPANKQELLNEYFATDAKPSECFVHPIECNPKENPYNVQYIRTHAVPSGEDAKTYDLGVVHIATQGLPAASTNCGEIWVSYEVELRKPQLNTSDVQSVQFVSSGTVSTTNQMGTAPAVLSGAQNSLGITVSGKVITFPRGTMGRFIAVLNFIGSSMTTTYGATTFSNCAASNIFTGTDGRGFDASSGTFSTRIWGFEITDPSVVATMTLNFSTLTNVSYNELTISQLDSQN